MNSSGAASRRRCCRTSRRSTTATSTPRRTYPTTGPALGSEPMTGTVRVAAAQLPGCGADAAANRRVAALAVRDAAEAGADLVLLPELATTPYFCKEDPERFRDLAEPIGGPLVAAFSELGRELA